MFEEKIELLAYGHCQHDQRLEQEAKSVNQIDSVAGFADVRQWSWPVSAGLDDFVQVLHLPKNGKDFG